MRINLNQFARKVDVDNSLPLRYYFRIADNLLHQASIYREENDVVNLYIILLRFSSLVSETIPFHRDYKGFPSKHRANYRKKFASVLDELELLKPECYRILDKLNEEDKTSESATIPYSAWRYDSSSSDMSSPNPYVINQPSNKLFLSLPPPKQETRSRHSFLGPNGLYGQSIRPREGIKVQYPSSTGLISGEESSNGMNQYGKGYSMPEKDGDSVEIASTFESVLSLDDGRWQNREMLTNEASHDPFQFVAMKQPSPPPVHANVHHEIAPIPPSRVADPWPGPAKPKDDRMNGTSSYQDVHVPVSLMDEFLRLARANTQKNLETCGVLAGLLKNRVFHICTLIIPKQESTSDSCSTLNEEEIFEVQDKLSLFPLGWIHTHPTQTCFMSSVDLHTHYSYQVMLPEAIAIVMAPTDSSTPHGIFHLSDPSGVSVIRQCDQRGFHPHEEPSDGNSIYEHCSHVYLNSKLKYEIVDLR